MPEKLVLFLEFILNRNKLDTLVIEENEKKNN
jgi:hypothetical protein